MARENIYTIAELEAKGWNYSNIESYPYEEVLYEDFPAPNNPTGSYYWVTTFPYYGRKGLAGGASVYTTNNVDATYIDKAIIPWSVKLRGYISDPNKPWFQIANIPLIDHHTSSLNVQFTAMKYSSEGIANERIIVGVSTDNGATFMTHEVLVNNTLKIFVEKFIVDVIATNIVVRFTNQDADGTLNNNVAIGRISINEQHYNGCTSKIWKTFPDNETYSFDITTTPCSIGTNCACIYATAIENGYERSYWAPGEMYFPKDMLYQWISPQQLEQFEKMYPDCVDISYQSALGYVYSQIGELYDMEAILSGDTNDGTAKIMRWILTVLTAYNLSSPSMKHSQTLLDNFDMVTKKVIEMKNGATTLNSGPIKEEPNAWGDVINNSKNKMLG